MTSSASSFQSNSEPFLRRMKQFVVQRLESLADNDDTGIFSQRSSNANSAQNSPNASAATFAQSPRSRRSSRHYHQHNHRSSEELQRYQQSNEGLNLRRVNGRLTVPRDEIDAVPQALPTDNFYNRFPGAVGPLANVVVTSRSELAVLKEMCDPVEVVKARQERDAALNRLCMEDVSEGGFFIYAAEGEPSQYFKLRVTAPAEVYGASAYIRR